ncbi:MAG: hypothetical protein K0U98_07555 [Deltaproteobacteria bacterium]|nr:hypothetical protein [Deltaproteobacteria bacterium]
MARNKGLDEDFESFLSQVQPRLRKTLAFYSIPPADAETLLKDLFLTLLYKRQSIASPELWLVNTLRHQCVVYWRRHRFQLYSNLDKALKGTLAGLQGSLEDGGDSSERGRLLRKLDALVAELPPSYRNQLRQQYSQPRDGMESSGGARAASSLSAKELELCLASLGNTFSELGLATEDGSKNS